jgi:hypothetical protein
MNVSKLRQVPEWLQPIAFGLGILMVIVLGAVTSMEIAALITTFFCT